MTIVLWLCAAMLGAACLCGLWRLLSGPGVVDRMLAFDAIAICGVGLAVVFSLMNDSIHFQDLILVYCLIGFAATVAFVFYLGRNDTTPGKNDPETKFTRKDKK